MKSISIPMTKPIILIFFLGQIIIISSSLLSSKYVNHSFPYDIPCGKSNPKEDDDCVPYGTDTGMNCCLFFNKVKNSKQCIMISNERAEKSGIDGIKDFGDEYWNCGNRGKFLVLFKELVFAMVALLLL